MMNWTKAEEYLSLCEKAFSEIGSSGMFALSFVIMPLRDRFNKDERTTELYNEIFEIKL
jgi:hypothetical protein